MRGEIHGHVHDKKDKKVKTAAVMRQKVKFRFSRCAVEINASGSSDATPFAIPSLFSIFWVAERMIFTCGVCVACQPRRPIYMLI